MNEAARNKLWRIARALRARTRHGEADWEETDRRGRFAIVLADTSFVIERNRDDQKVYDVMVQDDRGMPIERWEVGPGRSFLEVLGTGATVAPRPPSGSNYTPKGEDESMLAIVRDLYELVRRDVWDVDEKLDAVLRELDE